jgi:hypothetical protein
MGEEYRHDPKYYGANICQNILPPEGGGGVTKMTAKSSRPSCKKRRRIMEKSTLDSTVAEFKIVPNFNEWPYMMQVGMLLMADTPDWYPNLGNVYFWGVKTDGGRAIIALEGLTQKEQSLLSFRRGYRHAKWVPRGGNPPVLRVSQVWSGGSWQLSFEVTGDFNGEPISTYKIDVKEQSYLAGIFAKNFNAATKDARIKFEQFQLHTI